MARILLVATLLLMSVLPDRESDLTCEEVRDFIHEYGYEEAMRRAILMGLSTTDVDYIIRTCFESEA